MLGSCPSNSDVIEGQEAIEGFWCRSTYILYEFSDRSSTAAFILSLIPGPCADRSEELNPTIKRKQIAFLILYILIDQNWGILIWKTNRFILPAL